MGGGEDGVSRVLANRALKCAPEAMHSGGKIDLTICIECGKRARLTDGKTIYPHRRDLYKKYFYRCECGAYVGCHQLTSNPLGRPAGPETRKARMAAHEAFDPIWKSGRLSRSGAYHWLADRMGTLPGQTHISWMTAPEAKRVVIYCKALVEAEKSSSQGLGAGAGHCTASTKANSGMNPS